MVHRCSRHFSQASVAAAIVVLLLAPPGAHGRSLTSSWVMTAAEEAPMCAFPTGSWLDGIKPETWHADLPCTWRVESIRSFVSCMANTTIVVIGDSMVRYTIWTYIAILHRCGTHRVSPRFGPAPAGYAAECERIGTCSGSHMDCSFRYEASGVFIQFHFLWMPFANELLAHPLYATLVRNATVDTFVWLSMGLWTVKHEASGGNKDAGENLQPGDISNPVNKALVEELVANTTFGDSRMKQHLLWRSLPSVEHGDPYGSALYTGDYIRERNYDLDQVWRKAGFPVQNVERYTYHPNGKIGKVHTWDATHSQEYIIAAATREAMSYFCGIRQRRLREAASDAGVTAPAACAQQSHSTWTLVQDAVSVVEKTVEAVVAECATPPQVSPCPPHVVASCAPQPSFNATCTQVAGMPRDPPRDSQGIRGISQHASIDSNIAITPTPILLLSIVMVSAFIVLVVLWRSASHWRRA